MVITKDRLQDIVNHLPETFSFETLIEELLLLEKVEKARLQMKNGEFVSEEEMDREIDSWQ